ncbi:MAG: SpoIID/LytB domain-containing protein [Candidatus Omnitrophota bacterium]
MRFLILLLISGLLFFPPNSLAKSLSHQSKETALEDYLDIAALFKESGEYAKAIDVLNKARVFSKNPQLLRYRGKLEFLNGRSRQALISFKNLKDKGWPDFLYLGLIYEDLGKEALAIANYTKSLKLEPNTIAYFRLGKIYRRNGEYKKAAQYFSSLIKFDSSIRLAYYYLGQCLYEQGADQDAYKLFSKAINFYPEVGIIQKKFKALKQSLGEDFFRAQKEKQQAKRKKVKLAVYLQEENIPLVRVGLARDLNKFSFFCGSKFLISSADVSFPARANKLYTLIVSGEEIVLSDYEQGGKYASFSGPLKIVAQDSQEGKSSFYVLDLIFGKGDFWYTEADRAYRGDLEVVINNGALNLINSLTIEEYLYGVLSAEISAKAHPQALRAQAVAARTFAYRNLGRHKNEGFDFCPQVHCQVYQGISAEVLATEAAIKDTRGEIIVYQDNPIEALFHANCGGCLAADVFGRSDYLVNKRDTLNLEIPDSAYSQERWFDSPEISFCFKNSRSKFRWQRVYDQEDFLIAFGYEINALKAVLPKKRGDCFRYNEIEIITSSGSKDLKGSLTIRNYFDRLRSSAFKLERKLSPDGQSSMLFLWGAGFGHGAGMCQDGAVGMADNGYNYHQIINHYFPQTKIEKLY